MICPNCGGEMTGERCPFCGTVHSAAPQADAQTRAQEPDRGRPFPGNAPDRGNDSQWVDEFARWSDETADDSELPVARFIRKLAKSPLMLFCSILATLYAGGIGFTLGAASLGTTQKLLANNFDSYFSNDKIGRTIFLISCFIHIGMALWLLVSMWSLFCSAHSRKKPNYDVGWFNSFLSFARVGRKLFLLLAVISAAGMALMLLDVDFSNTLFYSIGLAGSSAGMHIGLSHVIARFLGENDLRMAVLVVIFVFDTIRFTMLTAVFSMAGGMLRFDEPTRWKIPPVAAFSFLRGVIWLGVSAYTLLTEKTTTMLLLLYLPLCVLGLTLIFGSLLLGRFCTGVKQRQGE